jgi:diadenosine tetraphosphate (Ap4A) HIT family hydrolase
MGQLDTARRAGCELCERDGGILVVRTERLRVIRADDAEHPAFYRVVWNDHVAEWTDLAPADRSHIMQAVAKVETVLREHLQPSKINLAALGNMVPHLHWHVIARFEWDARWPAPVWAPLARSVPDAAARLALPLAELDALVAQAIQAWSAALITA